MNRPPRYLLLGLAIAAGSIPAAAQSNALSALTVGPTAKPFSFEIVSIRPHPADSYAATNYLPDGLQLIGFNAWAFINNSYSSKEPWSSSTEVRNVPAWGYSEHYDLNARVAVEDQKAWHEVENNIFSSEITKIALQAVLRDRFKLAVHLTTEQKPCMDLVIGSHGPKLQTAASVLPKTVPGKTRRVGDGISIQENGSEHFFGVSMADLAQRLSMVASGQTTIQDKTGLTGRYDFTLPYYGQDPEVTGLDRMPVSGIGLVLKPGMAPVTVINIDHIERPDAN